jgi:hypothetical protein
MKIDYKILLILITFLFSGCYNTIPTKVYKNPSKFGFDAMIPTYWDGQYPIKYWESTIKVGEKWTDWNGITWVIEKHPTEEGVLIVRTDISE